MLSKATGGLVVRRIESLSIGLVIGLAAACEAPDSPPHHIDQSWGALTPSAPKNDSVVAGDREITVHFTPTDGSLFAASCRVGSESGPAASGQNATKSPAVVPNLTNGTEYACAVWAFNYSKVSPPSNFLKATLKAP
jgi:hypothetical protein